MARHATVGLDRTRFSPVVPFTLWLVIWAAFGLPWGDLHRAPDPSRIQWTLNPLRRPDDVLVNLLFYAPFGAMCASWGWRLTAAAGAGAAMSGLTETSQLFSRSRVPSLRDFVLNTVGTMAGFAWAAWRRSIAAKRRVEPSRVLPRRRVA